MAPTSTTAQKETLRAIDKEQSQLKLSVWGKYFGRDQSV